MEGNNRVTLIRVITQSIIGIMTVAGMFYLLINAVEIPQLGWYAIMIVIASVYGFDSILSLLNNRKKEK